MLLRLRRRWVLPSSTEARVMSVPGATGCDVNPPLWKLCSLMNSIESGFQEEHRAQICTQALRTTPTCNWLRHGRDSTIPRSYSPHAILERRTAAREAARVVVDGSTIV